MGCASVSHPVGSAFPPRHAGEKSLPCSSHPRHHRRFAVAGIAMSESSLWWGLLFGSIGLGYAMYGKAQRMGVPLACGVALMVFPYLVSNGWAMAIIGGVLVAVPWVVRI